MTEQRKSLPQAEILLKNGSCMFVASKSYLYLARSVRVLVTALRSHDRTSSQSQPSGYPYTKQLVDVGVTTYSGHAPTPSTRSNELLHRYPSLGLRGVVLTLFPEKWWTEVLDNLNNC
jgi:hypothetical protein